MTDAEAMRERARIQTALQMAFTLGAGHEVDVTGFADPRTNTVFGWLLTVKRGGLSVDHTMQPDATVASAVEALRTKLAVAEAKANAALLTSPTGAA